MPQTSNAAERSTEQEAPLSGGSIFDESQPMTYDEVDRDEDPTQGVDLVTDYDKGEKDSEPDEHLPDHVRAYRELQSKADKDAQALKKLQEEYESQKTLVEDFNTYKPIIRYLEENPHIIDQLAKVGREPQTKQNPDLPVQEELVAPVKPRDYDKFAAYNDPDSESFKYREALEDYRFKRMEAAEHEIERKKQEYEAFVAQKEAEAQRRMAEAELHKVLARDYQMSEKERADFITFSSNPNPDLGTLVDVFRRMTGAGIVPDKPAKPGKEVRTITDAPGAGAENMEVDPNAVFSRNLTKGRKDLFGTV